MEKRNVLLGITGSIAAYKACSLIKLLKKDNLEIKAIMTSSACKLIVPESIRTLTCNPVHIEMFNADEKKEIEHISLAKWCDLLAIVPATGNIIGKIANGIADDLLSTVVMALPQATPVVVAPAMNTNMWLNESVQRNVKTLKRENIKVKNNALPKYTFVGPKKGRLACEDIGEGALAEIDEISKKIKELLKIVGD